MSGPPGAPGVPDGPGPPDGPGEPGELGASGERDASDGPGVPDDVSGPHAPGERGSATRDGWRDRPSDARLSPDHPQRAEILAAHAAACAAGEPGYIDPASGYLALTADTLASRGACCGSGCRHCPWEP